MERKNLFTKHTVIDSTSNEDQKQDYLTNETPIAISYNGITHVVMMATPEDLEDFVVGFSYTEGVISSATDIFDIDIKNNINGIEIAVNIDQENFQKLKQVKRNLSGKTGCGICGVESLDYFYSKLNHSYPKKRETELSHDSILLALDTFTNNHLSQKITGSMHAVALFNKKLEMLSIREDVGRHNALDKLIGAILKNNYTGQFVICSSRASYEMVQKVLMTDIPILIAVSAPTSMAVDLAEKNSLTLLGFAREKRFVIYTHKERIIK